MTDRLDTEQTAVREFVELDLPVHAKHASTVRAVAASMAAEAGYTVDEIDDLRLGVNEAVSLLTDVDAPPEARLRLRFIVGQDELVMTARCEGVDRPIDQIDELADRILRAVVDRYMIGDDGTFVLVKRMAGDGRR